jgi:hypothetical protein
VRFPSRLAAFVLFALLVVVLLYGDAFVGGLVLSQSDILFGYAPWSAHAPDGFTRPGNDLLGDIPQVFYPFLQQTAQTLRSGALPVWTTGIFAGHPYLASFQTATFSPFTLPALVLPTADALLVAAIAKLLVGALGMWLLLGRYGLSPAAVWFGAAAYLLNPFSVCWAEHPVSNVSAWLPFLLWAADRLLVSRGARDVALLGLMVGVVILAGHPETSYKVLLFGGVYVLVGIAATSADAGATRGARARAAVVTLFTRFGPAAVLGFVLAAIQLVPFAEYLLQSYVWEMRRGFTANAYPAAIETLVTSIVPNFLGNPSKGTYLPMQNSYGVVSNFCEQMIYPGIAAWVLAAVGVVAARGAWRVRFFAGSVIVAAALMYGAPGFVDLLMLVPGASVVVLTRFGVVAIASAMVLAAFGVDALTRTAPTRDETRPREDLAPTAPIWPALATVALMIAGIVPFLVWARSFLSANGLLGWTLAWSAGAVALGALVTAAVALRARGRLSARAFAVLAVVLITGDLFALGWRFHPMIPRAQVFPSTPALDFVKADRGLFRVAGIGDSLIPNTAMAYGLQDLRGYDGMQPMVHGDVVGISHKGGAYRVIRESETFHVLDLMNVKYIFAKSTQQLPAPHFTPVVQESGATLYRNERTFSRAFLVGRVRIASPPDSLRLIRADEVDLRREAVLYEPLPEGQTIDAAEPGAEGVARVTRYEDTFVEIETEAVGRRLLVLSDLDYPGWRAAIDGAPARIVRADRGLRGVVLPAGRHRVTFTFAPLSVRIGAWLTLASAALLVALACVSGRRLPSATAAAAR